MLCNAIYCHYRNSMGYCMFTSCKNYDMYNKYHKLIYLNKISSSLHPELLYTNQTIIKVSRVRQREGY